MYQAQGRALVDVFLTVDTLAIPQWHELCPPVCRFTTRPIHDPSELAAFYLPIDDEWDLAIVGDVGLLLGIQRIF
jgi:hypothetical protein